LKNISDQEYGQLKKAFAELFSLMPTVDIPPDKHPLAILSTMEQKSPAQARKGLNMALNDLIAMSREWSAARVTEVDAQLAGKGITTLSQLRHRYSRAYAKILKRDVIRTITEYHVVKDALDRVVDANEIKQISNMLEAFELESHKE
jgi:hypothetical protein